MIQECVKWFIIILNIGIENTPIQARAQVEFNTWILIVVVVVGWIRMNGIHVQQAFAFRRNSKPDSNDLKRWNLNSRESKYFYSIDCQFRNFKDSKVLVSLFN